MPSGTVDDSPEPGGRPIELARVGQAEASPSIPCAACHQPIVDHYFEINRTVVCDPCRESIEFQLRGGSGLGRFAGAAALGLIAAVAGTALYSAFLTFSAIDLSLVAILIGYMVGRMVRKGGGGIGGTPYQLLAVALTYASLGMTYFTATLVALAIPITPGLVFSTLSHAFQMPVLRMKSSPIQIAFVGFALWEAWKLNRPRRLVVTGPHPVEGIDRRAGATSDA